LRRGFLTHQFGILGKHETRRHAIGFQPKKPLRARFDVAHLGWNFLFYLIKQVKIEKYEALQYKPDAQASDREIHGNIPSLARRARISATSKRARGLCTSRPICLHPKCLKNCLRQTNFFVRAFSVWRLGSSFHSQIALW
jgi:hypothetical protein